MPPDEEPLIGALCLWPPDEDEAPVPSVMSLPVLLFWPTAEGWPLVPEGVLELGVVDRSLPVDLFVPGVVPPEDEVCAKASDADPAASAAIAMVETAIFDNDMVVLTNFSDASI
jgi:hypothetical protein